MFMKVIFTPCRPSFFSPLDETKKNHIYPAAAVSRSSPLRPSRQQDRLSSRERERPRDGGGCFVCADEHDWGENPLIYCDGQGCNVAVHQTCSWMTTTKITSVPTGPWYCRKCESQERAARVRCELCPSREGALRRTINGNWAHVICTLYIPEVRFGNVSTMEPIILTMVPKERYLKSCYICQSSGRVGEASSGACMNCNWQRCKQSFHVTCAQLAGLLCEEAGNYKDNVKYCGYCEYHYQKLNIIKLIPAFKPTKSIANNSSASSASSGWENSSPDTSSNPQPLGQGGKGGKGGKLPSRYIHTASKAYTNRPAGDPQEQQQQLAPNQQNQGAPPITGPNQWFQRPPYLNQQQHKKNK